MKIKTKKQLNLPQLIEWAWENLDKVQSESFISNVSDFFGNYSTIHFSVDGYGFRTDGVSNKDTFTIEVEEEITEDTKFRHIVFIDDCGLSASWGNSSINDIKYGKDKEFHAYIDGEFKCIWRDGKLVE